jgi:DNA (cytosine-5)-methyltransferase 1
MKRLLDLFCGAGGASMGYHRAGFDVVGVDIRRQPRYPFEFHQADALTYPLEGFDVIHASPPCQAFTKLLRARAGGGHPDLLGPTRERLTALSVPWVIENVPGAPMRADVVLCGSMFGLKVRRHRWFECAHPVLTLCSPCAHPVEATVGVYGHTGGTGRHSVSVWREAMGIDWMTATELSQAIPPAYTEWLGAQLMTTLT